MIFNFEPIIRLHDNKTEKSRMPLVAPCLPRGTGYRELTETESTKELDLSNHLTEVPKSSKNVLSGHVSARRPPRSKGVLKAKNFWLCMISALVFLAMFVCLRILAHLDPVRVRELSFQRTRYVREPEDLIEMRLFDLDKNYLEITNHVVADLTVPGTITFEMELDERAREGFTTFQVNANKIMAFNCSEECTYGRAVVEVEKNVYYLYYFTPATHLQNLIQADFSDKTYERSSFFVPKTGPISEAAFIGDDVYIREYSRELIRRFVPGGSDYYQMISYKLRRINKIIREYKKVELVVKDDDYYFLCRETEKDQKAWLLFIVLDGVKIRGMYEDRVLSLGNTLSLHFTENEVMVLEQTPSGTIEMDYVKNVEEMRTEMQLTLYSA